MVSIEGYYYKILKYSRDSLNSNEISNTCYTYLKQDPLQKSGNSRQMEQLLCLLSLSEKPQKSLNCMILNLPTTSNQLSSQNYLVLQLIYGFKLSMKSLLSAQSYPVDQNRINQFHATGLFLYPLKTCFQGVQKETCGLTCV